MKLKFTKFFITFICTMLIFSFAAVYANGEKSTSTDKAQKIAGEVDDYIKALAENKEVVGASASIVWGDKTILLKGYGYADKEKAIAADPRDTAFRIGSVSKTFAALAAVQLAQSGKLDMHADIREYIGDFPETKYTITMHDLLTHSAGFEETGRGLAVESEIDMTSLEYTAKEYLPVQIYEPGETIAYSNYGIALAGYVIECIAGQDYSTYVREAIFKPFGMENSAFSCENTDKCLISLAYGKDGETRNDGIINYYPSGAITASASDMAGYMKGLLMDDCSVLNTEYKDMMFDKQFTMEDSFPGIGYAWGRYEQNGHLFFGHMGGTDNFSTLIMLCPEEDLGIFISCNTLADRALGQLFGIVAKELYGEIAGVPENVNDGTVANIDLKGSWCSTVRTEKGPEKIYNIFSTLRFGYDEKIGYEFMEEPFMRVGEDILFHPNFGYLKYTEEASREFLFTEESGALVKIPWYESVVFQAIVIGAFSFIAFVGFVFSIARLIKLRKESGIKVVERASYVVSILLFIMLAAQLVSIMMFFANIQYAGVDSFLTIKKILSYMVIAAGGVHLILSVSMYFLTKGKYLLKVFFGTIDFGFILYLFWMLHMNLMV